MATNGGLSEYGSTKFGLAPAGGARAGTSLGLLLFMMLPMLTNVDEAGKCLRAMEKSANMEVTRKANDKGKVYTSSMCHPHCF